MPERELRELVQAGSSLADRFPGDEELAAARRRFTRTAAERGGERHEATGDPVLTPLGFAPGQAGAADGRGQVIFCRGDAGSTDGDCVDLVIDLDASPDWHVIDVRYWGYPADRWHLPFDVDADLETQLAHLSTTLPGALD